MFLCVFACCEWDTDRTAAGSVGASVNARHVLDFTFCSHHFSPQCVCFTSNCSILGPYTSS